MIKISWELGLLFDANDAKKLEIVNYFAELKGTTFEAGHVIVVEIIQLGETQAHRGAGVAIARLIILQAHRRVLQSHIEARLEQDVVACPEQENGREISHDKAAVRTLHPAELHLGVACHGEVVQRAHGAAGDGIHRLDFGRRVSLLLRIGGQRLSFAQPLLQLLDGLLILFVQLFELANPLVLVGERAFQGIEILIADHRRRARSQGHPQRAGCRRRA